MKSDNRSTFFTIYESPNRNIKMSKLIYFLNKFVMIKTLHENQHNFTHESWSKYVINIRPKVFSIIIYYGRISIANRIIFVFWRTKRFFSKSGFWRFWKFYDPKNIPIKTGLLVIFNQLWVYNYLPELFHQVRTFI